MNKLLLLLSLGLTSTTALAEELRREFIEDASLKAFGEYWRNFDDYEKHKFLNKKGQYFEAWDRLRAEWKSTEKRLTAEQIEDLKRAAQKYERQIKEHPTAGSTPYARMNLAQVYNQIGIHQDSNTAAETFKKQALAVLADLNKNLPNFALNDEVLYLRATILESLDSEETAANVWHALAKNGSDSIYTVHAHLALGDNDFSKEKSESAYKSYQKARDILSRIQSPDAEYEKIRVNYRIAWAAYRSADLEASMTAAQALLRPELDFRRVSFQKKMGQDACDLMGDALFETKKVAQMKDYLERDFLKPYASNIGLRILSRLASQPSQETSIELGQFLLDRYPASRESPEIATILADNYRTLGLDSQYVATLERISLMLPRNSVWRIQHQNEPRLLAAMEQKALNANQLLAGKFYEEGMVQGNHSSFETAKTYFDTLLKFDPQHPAAETWELRRANSLYFAQHYEEADKAFEAFKKRGKVDAENLETAYYQQTLSRERIWRNSLAKFDESGTKPDAISMGKLRNLQDSISAYADRFPGKNRVVDLMLLAANANRDLGDYATAENFWNRALLSDPTATQRTLAVRGLVQSKVKSGKPEETLALARNYLKLEDFDQLGAGFQSELMGVVANSAKAYATQLNNKGKIQEAGELLLAVSKEFPSIPERDTLYRDGAYYMALSGKWKDSERAANEYLAESSKGKSTEDLLYLKARSLEYQLRFHQAAEAHLALVEKFPRFDKASQSASRSEVLAAAEDDFRLAGKASLALANLQKNEDQKTETLLRSADYYAKARSWSDALKTLARIEGEARSSKARLTATLQTAKIWSEQGEDDKALASFRKLATEVEEKKEDLDKDLYRRISAEANYRMAEAAAKAIDDITKVNFEKTLALYNKAIDADDAEWSSRARFQAAELAEKVAQSLRSKIAFNEKKPNPALSEQAKRWLQVSQQYHAQNLLVKQKDPYRFRDVVWVERSALKASGMQPQLTPASRALPSALDNSQPYQWSH